MPAAVLNMRAANMSELGRTATADVPATVSDKMEIFTYLSDDSEDDDEVPEVDMHAIKYWQRKYEDQQLVKKAYARSKAHKKTGIAALMKNLPRPTQSGLEMPAEYTPFRQTSFDLRKYG